MKKVTTKEELIKTLIEARVADVFVNGYIFSMFGGVYTMRFFEVFSTSGDLIVTYEGEDYEVATDSIAKARKIVEGEVTSYALRTA